MAGRFGDSHDLGFACGRCGSRIANWVEFVWVCGCFHLPTPQISRRDSGQLAVGKRIATYGFDVTRHADREAGHRIPSGRTGALYRLGRRTGSSHRGPRDHGGQRARARRFQVALSVASECGIARALAATPEGSRKRLAHPTGGIASAQPPANRCHALGVVMDVAVPPTFHCTAVGLWMSPFATSPFATLVSVFIGQWAILSFGACWQLALAVLAYRYRKDAPS